MPVFTRAFTEERSATVSDVTPCSRLKMKSFEWPLLTMIYNLLSWQLSHKEKKTIFAPFLKKLDVITPWRHAIADRRTDKKALWPPLCLHFRKHFAFCSPLILAFRSLACLCAECL